jgi:hypothetical protein
MPPRGNTPGLKIGRTLKDGTRLPYWYARNVVRDPMGYPDQCINLPIGNCGETMEEMRVRLGPICQQHTARLFVYLDRLQAGATSRNAVRRIRWRGRNVDRAAPVETTFRDGAFVLRRRRRRARPAFCLAIIRCCSLSWSASPTVSARAQSSKANMACQSASAATGKVAPDRARPALPMKYGAWMPAPARPPKPKMRASNPS